MCLGASIETIYAQKKKKVRRGFYKPLIHVLSGKSKKKISKDTFFTIYISIIYTYIYIYTEIYRDI
jgi:hypothetical protein